MLYFETIDKVTLALLEAIQRLEVFRNFRLVGGTALALQIGHRKSIDLDFLCNRGSKKDFYDIYFLLDQFSLKDMLGFYGLKLSDASPFLVLKSLTYFDDADTDDDPNMLVPLSWKEVKNRILDVHADYLRTNK